MSATITQLAARCFEPALSPPSDEAATVKPTPRTLNCVKNKVSRESRETHMTRSSADRSPVEHWSRRGVSARNELRFANGATKRTSPHTIVRSLHHTRGWSPKSLLYVERMARTSPQPMEPLRTRIEQNLGGRQ